MSLPFTQAEILEADIMLGKILPLLVTSNNPTLNPTLGDPNQETITSKTFPDLWLKDSEVPPD